MSLTANTEKQGSRENPQETRGRPAAAIRLQVYMAHAGAASRRGAEKLIAEGRVEVNGVRVDSMGVKVLPTDKILLDGKPLAPETRFHYIVLNKPPEYICASKDPQGRRLALELLPPVKERLYNVGRLDYLSSGLIIFTNDGDFAARLGHPSFNIEKEYIVESTVPVPDQMVDEFLRGIVLDGVMYRALELEKLERKTIRIVLGEGKNREIRRVFSHFHLHPEKLKRVRIGPLRLGNLAEGESRPMEETEKKELEEYNGYSH